MTANKPTTELVVLVDEKNCELGTAPKATVHTKDTPLHRGFSLFIFNPKGELLLTRRALTKKTFPGVWTNTVCGHPGVGERPLAAAKRRLQEELGMIADDIEEVTVYRYQFADVNGIMENEICPVFLGYSDMDPKPDPAEAGEWKWMDWQDFLEAIQLTPDIFSPWCREEALFVAKALYMTRHGNIEPQST